MPARVVMFGIDGLDHEILQRHLDSLPNIKNLCRAGGYSRLDSTFPPDSDTAWATIFSGLDPSHHGLVKFVDPLEKSISYQQEEADSTKIKGKCVWDNLSEFGCRVCVLLPHAAFPPWKVNGLMVSRSSLTNHVKCEPGDVLTEPELSHLKAPRGFPGKTRKSMSAYIESSRSLLKSTEETSLRLLDLEEWDFFFTYSPVLDIVSHFFWKYYDVGDPSHPGDNPYSEIIPHLYRSHDEFIGQLLRRMRSDDLFLVISDHGHGRRPTLEFKMNERLRTEGLLEKKLGAGSTTHFLGESVTKVALRLSQTFNLENLYSTLLTRLPTLRSTLTRPSSIDWENTSVAMVDMSGIKSYNYGGLRVNRRLLVDPIEYESLREHIIRMMDEIADPRSGRKIVQWAKRREDLYSGEHINKYPDIVYLLAEEYGFSPMLGGPLIERSRVQSVVPGTHIGKNAVLVISGPQEAVNRFDSVSVYDIATRIREHLLGSTSLERSWRRE